MCLQKAGHTVIGTRRFVIRYFREEKDLYFGKCRVIETEGFSFSSSHIINNFLDIYPEDTKRFLKEFKEKYTFADIADRINTLKDLKVLIIGDGIIDEYHYCEPLGKSAKANLVVSKYLSHETFAGGTFAVGNHTAVCASMFRWSLSWERKIEGVILS